MLTPSFNSYLGPNGSQIRLGGMAEDEVRTGGLDSCTVLFITGLEKVLVALGWGLIKNYRQDAVYEM